MYGPRLSQNCKHNSQCSILTAYAVDKQQMPRSTTHWQGGVLIDEFSDYHEFVKTQKVKIEWKFQVRINF